MAQELMMYWVLVGLVIGLIGAFLFGTNLIWRYLAAGVAGSLAVSFAIAYFGIDVPIANWLMRQLSVAAAGAVFVVTFVRVVDTSA